MPTQIPIPETSKPVSPTTITSTNPLSKSHATVNNDVRISHHDPALKNRRRHSSFFSPSPAPPSPSTYLIPTHSVYNYQTNHIHVLDEKEISAFTHDNRHFSMLRNLHIADFITLLNGCCGFMAIISLITYTQLSYPNEAPHMSSAASQWYLKRAMVLVPLGLFFDFMDGRVARWRHKASLIGQELDSLADLVSFGVAPGSIAYTIGLSTSLDTVLLAVFVLCGLTRLARFNVTVANLPKDEKTGKSKYFEGTPIPTTLSLVALMYVLLVSGKTGPNIPFGLVFKDTAFEFHPLVLLFLVSGSAMISKSLHVPKI